MSVRSTPVARGKKMALPEDRGTGQYAVQAVHEDKIRLDLLDTCIPSATGEPTDGWGCAFLTHDQALGLAKVLTRAALLVKPGGAKKPAKKTARKKK